MALLDDVLARVSSFHTVDTLQPLGSGCFGARHGIMKQSYGCITKGRRKSMQKKESN